VILVDANLLLYAYQPRAAQHEQSRAWLEGMLSGTELVRFAWLTLWVFVRIGTNPRVFEAPLMVPEAEAIVSSWLAQSNVGILEPAERHWEILCGLMRDGQTTGARHGCRARGHRLGARCHSLHDGPRLCAVSRAQVGQPACCGRLTSTHGDLDAARLFETSHLPESR
jgi:hypothetical protein